MTKLIRILAIVTTLALTMAIIGYGAADDDHQKTEPAVKADDHDDDDDHDHVDELIVELTPEAARLAGISISRVSHGRIDRTLDLPGEVGFNEDRLAHIAPRFAGIGIRSMYRVGDYVDSGAVVAIVESNESMNPYSIKAPISGWVIERHITPGEFVSEENSIYLIADLSNVWVNLAVYPGDADRVKKGQKVRIKAVGADIETTGTIEYVTPIMDVHTRSLTARVVLPNTDNEWRPGTFVQGTITIGTDDEGLIVARDAVQQIGDESIVFVVEGENHFKPVEVITGDHDEKNVRILAGLEQGTPYVATGAFELKAKIVTGAMDGHAGHGH